MKRLALAGFVLLVLIVPFMVGADNPTQEKEKKKTTVNIAVVPDVNVLELSAHGRSAARIIIKGLSDKGYNVVNSFQLQQVHDQVRAQQNDSSMNQAMRDVGGNLKADLVIALEVTHTIKGFDTISKQYAANGRVAGQAVVVGTGQILHDGSFKNEYGSGASEQEAAQSAIKKAGADYLKALVTVLEKWAAQSQ